MFSGLNLAFFSASKLRLEVEAKKKNAAAIRVLALREDGNFLLVTVLWGNVGVNVLLAMLSGSVLTGVWAFFFSTFVITLMGEIAPQAYFSRHAIRMASLLAPLMRFYQFLLYPVARPTAYLLDWWLGREGIQYFGERELRELVKLHIAAPSSEIDLVEGRGALNFLALDDLPVKAEGEMIDPESVLALPFEGEMPRFPIIAHSSQDPFLRRVSQSGKQWVILLDEQHEPRMVLNADAFLRDALFAPQDYNPHKYCHRPILVRDIETRLGELLPRLRVQPEHIEDDVIDQDIILIWGEQKRVITGSDILGRLLRGIVQNH